jgi:hypothetical protein
MQKILLPLIIAGIALTSLTACAQNSHLDKFYQKYQSTPASGSHDAANGNGSGSSASSSGDAAGKTSITISSDDGSLSLNPSFMLNACFPASDGQAASGWVRKMTNLHVIILDGKKNSSAHQEWTELEESLKQDQFEELLTIRKGSDRVRLLSKDAAAGIKEVAFLVAGKDGSGLFFHFRGHFTEKDMASIQSVLQSHDSQ